MAFLVKDTNLEKSKQCVEKAIELNPYLLEKIIYNQGERPNIFEQQTSFLSITGNIFDIMIHYYDITGDDSKKIFWNHEYEKMIFKE